MSYIPTIARYLLGVIFVVLSLNYWLGFIEVPPPERDEAGDFMGAIYGSGYLTVVKVFELLCGVLLISGRYVNLALTILGAIVVNISLYHIFLEKGGYLMAVVVSLLALVTLAGRREFIKTLLSPK